MAFGPRNNPYDPTGPKIYACPACKKVYTSQEDLDDHLATKHRRD